MESLKPSFFGNLSLRQSIFLLLVFVSIGLTSTTLLIVNSFTEKAIDNILDDELRNTKLVFENYQAMQSRHTNKLVSKIPFLKALISTKDHATILEFAKKLKKQTGSDLFLVTDNAGNILANTEKEHSTDNLKSHPLIMSARGGQEITGIVY